MISDLLYFSANSASQMLKAGTSRLSSLLSGLVSVLSAMSPVNYAIILSVDSFLHSVSP